MPELPEVETLRAELDKFLVGQTVSDIELKSARLCRRHRSRQEFAARLQGRALCGVRRRGLLLLVGLDNGDALGIHLGTDGRILKQQADAGSERATVAALALSDDTVLRFLDLRDAAELFVASGDAVDEATWTESLIDPLGPSLSWRNITTHLLQRPDDVASALLDPVFCAGIGPLYRDEILWHAGLRGARPCASLSTQETRRLYRAIQEVMQDALRLRGSSVGERPFLDLGGSKGEYQDQLRVYRREGLPCRRCRAPLACAQDDTQARYFCLKCQS